MLFQLNLSIRSHRNKLQNVATAGYHFLNHQYRLLYKGGIIFLKPNIAI